MGLGDVIRSCEKSLIVIGSLLSCGIAVYGFCDNYDNNLPMTIFTGVYTAGSLAAGVYFLRNS